MAKQSQNFRAFLVFHFLEKITKLRNFVTKNKIKWISCSNYIRKLKKIIILLFVLIIIFTILKTCSGGRAGWMFVFCVRFRRFAPRAHARANTQTLLPESVFSFSSLLSLSLSATSAATVVLRRFQIQFCEASMHDLSSFQ